MARARGILRRNLAVAVLAGIALVMFGGSALAGHVTSNVKSYTGCLTPGDGVIIKVKEGNSPRSACTGGATEVHFSGGDITRISVSGGLELGPNGGDNGHVEISLKAGFSLPQGCGAGRVAEWDGSKWICGLDNDTTYSEGTGLDLSAGNAFGIEPAYQVKNTPDCSSGQFATGFDGDGDIQCAAPPAPATQVFANVQSTGLGIPSDGSLTDVVTLNVPAGAYSITAVGNAAQDQDRDTNMFCKLLAGSTVIAVTSLLFEGPTNTTMGGRPLSMIGLRNLSGPTVLKVMCQTTIDGAGAENWGIQAIKIG